MPSQAKRTRPSGSQAVRDALLRRYIEPARRSGHLEVRVVAGDLVRALGMARRVPQVCNAMRTRRFLLQNGLEIIKQEGPPSGESTTVAITYRLSDAGANTRPSLMPLYGILRSTLATEGGSEAYLRRERTSFDRVRGRDPH